MVKCVHKNITRLGVAPKKEELLSAANFLKLSVDELDNVKSFDIRPARLGKDGWGGVALVYKMPVARSPYASR